MWASPCDDATVAALAPRVADWGFDVLELPVEQLGDWDPARTATVLGDLGLGASVCLVMPPGRELVAAEPATVRATQDYLRGVLDAAAAVGAPAIAGPAYTSVGRTWRMSDAEREAAYAQLRENLAPVVEHAAQVGVRIGVEPLNRYETSLLNTVDQTLDALDGLPARAHRARAGHLPPEHRGTRPGRRGPPGGRADRARPGVRQRPRRARRRPRRLARLPGRARRRRLRTGRCASSRSPRRTPRSRPRPRSGARSPAPRTRSPPTASPSSAG